MTISHLVRQSHRWIAIVFTLTVAGNFAAMPLAGAAGLPLWLTLTPLLPLFLLLVSGLYLFALPYAAQWSGKNRRKTQP